MIIGYIGKPRSGKTTFLASYVKKNNVRKKLNRFLLKPFRFHTYDVIYSTELIKDTVFIQPYDIGLFPPTPNSLILIGEAGVNFSNRDFKQASKQTLSFFALHGHYHVDIVWDSQTVDVDKKLRNRTHQMYIVSKGRFFRNLSFARLIAYDIDVDNDSHDIVEGYQIAKGLLKVLGYITLANKIIFRPFYYKYFDSYDKPLKFTKPDPAKKKVNNGIKQHSVGAPEPNGSPS